MDEHEMGESLIRSGAVVGEDLPDARHLARSFAARDEQRLRLLGGVILALWLIGAAGLGFVLYELSVHVPEYMKVQMQIDRGEVSPERRQGFLEGYLGGFQIGFCVTVGSVAIIALAALGTFLLVLASRRVTLRQVNASLRLISERLERSTRERVG
jgi:hypothetical protein